MDDLKPPEPAECGWYDTVRYFHIKFGHLALDTIQHPMYVDKRRYRALWLAEEMIEFVMANDIVEQADAMIDTIYFH